VAADVAQRALKGSNCGSLGQFCETFGLHTAHSTEFLRSGTHT
jgi:hypothetical protein